MCILRYIRVNITLTPEDLEHLDRLARQVGCSRSELIRDAVRAYRPEEAAAEARRPDPETVRQWLRTVRVRLPSDSAQIIRRLREGGRS